MTMMMVKTMMKKIKTTTDSEESDNGKGKNDAGIGSVICLDERFYAAIDILRNTCEKADIKCMLKYEVRFMIQYE